MARILVVEDDPIVGRMVQRTLSRLQHEVVVVDGGPAGLNRACADKFDLLITDLRMPEINGLDLLKLLRERQIFSPAILITACIDITLHGSASSLGIEAILVKPFQKKLLLESMNSALLNPTR